MILFRKSMLVLTITTAGYFTITMLTYCGSSAADGEKVAQAKAKEDEAFAQQDWVEAQRDSVADSQKFESESKARVVKNSHIIADFKVRIMTGEKAMKSRYQRRLNALEKQNNNLKNRLEHHVETSTEQWKIFKQDWGHDMDKLVKSLDEMTGSNK